MADAFVTPTYLEAIPLDLASTMFRFNPPGVAVKAGAPTAVPVKIGVLPVNARVSQISASMKVHSSGAGEPQETEVKVSEDGGKAKSFGIEFNVPSGLQNVQLKLDQGEVFWNRPGAVAPGLYQVPDFSKAVNEFLKKTNAAGGDTTLPFVVTSETAGNVEIELSAQFALIQDQTWTNELDGSSHADRNLPLQINQAVTIALDAIGVPAGRTLKRVSIALDASGQFGPDRVLGPLEGHDGHEFATVSPEYSVAQRLVIQSDVVTGRVQCSGVAALVKADPVKPGGTAPPVELYVELQPDENSTPANGAPLAKATIPFKPADSGEQPWTVAMFDASIELQADAAYWVVVKGVRGRVRVALARDVDRSGSAIVRSMAAAHRGGQTWKFLTARASRETPPHVLVAPLYTPGPENATAALELSIGGAPPLRVDPAAEPANVSLPLSSELPPQVDLVIRSAAIGTLTVANVQQTYELS
jgi:hypothetical protein